MELVLCAPESGCSLLTDTETETWRQKQHLKESQCSEQDWNTCANSEQKGIKPDLRMLWV